MKLAPATYQSWWDLHAWAGVLCSLVVYVMFFFGAWTLFFTPLTRWQEERGAVATPAVVDAFLDRELAAGRMQRDSLRIHLPRESDPGYAISYTDGHGDGADGRIDADGSLVQPRANVASFLYSLHYLQPPGAPRWLYTVAGLAAAMLLLVVVTGIAIHLRELFARFHQFRPRQRLRVVWSDAHKVLGTIGLPFAVIYSLTGVWMALDSCVQPRVTATVFRGDQAVSDRARDGAPAPGTDVPLSHVPGTRLPLAELYARARVAAVADHPVPARRQCRGVYYTNTGDRDATANFLCDDADVVLRQRDGSGFPVDARTAQPPLFQRLQTVPNELHFIEFAGTPLRAVWALLALSGCAAILTGNWLWLARRKASVGTAIVQRLTIAVGAGAVVAAAAIVLGNRLGATTASERSVFWVAWLAASVGAVAIRDPRAAWWRLLGVGGAMLAAAPLVGCLTMGTGLVRWPHGWDASHGVDVGLTVAGSLLLWIAARLRVLARRGGMA